MKRKGTVASIVLFVILAARTAAGGVLLHDDMDPKKQGAGSGRSVTGGEFRPEGTGTAWRAKNAGDLVRFVVPPQDNAAKGRGTLEIAFKAGDVQKTGSEAVCVVESSGKTPLLTLYYVPGFNVRGVFESVLLVDTDPESLGLRIGDFVSLGKAVPPGEDVRIAVVWDRGNPSRNGFYRNGAKLTSYRFDDFGVARAVAGATGLVDAMGAAASVRIGTDIRGKHAMSGSFLTGVTLYDHPIGQGDTGTGAIRSVTDDTFKAAGISGKLVAGDKVIVEMIAVPGGKATFDMGSVQGVPMEEIPAREAGPGIPATPTGTYRGSYAVRPGDDFEDGRIAGRFISADNVTSEPVLSDSKWTIDTKPRVAFRIDRKDLPADSTAKSRVKITATDANGNPVKGRRLKITPATTDQYTGTAGAGDFGKEVGASLEAHWKGETDPWGEMEFDYTAGFAAKTVILTAKDLESGGTAVDYITAYKEAAIDIALKKVVSRAAVRRSVQYLLKVEASRTELTADGRSRSAIRATLFDPNGTAVPGDPVTFALSSPNGTLRTIHGTTDASGTATAEYTAGKSIGIVVVTATATLRNAQGLVSITLLADAPAKILLKARPDSLPADGVSRADLQVKVTDINDNPNRDTKVEFRISRGGGKLDSADRTTDRFGEAANRYTSGMEAGIATILATVRSRVPTDAELARARNVLFVPYSPDGEVIRIEKWLKRKGETAIRGDGILEYTVGGRRDVKVLTAPFDLTIDRIDVEYWNNASTGDTLAQVTPKAK